ncbi:hypothetical protein ACWD45_11995 [Streptomyces rubiginosohelvolus]
MTDDPGTYTRRPKAERERDGERPLADQAASLSPALRRLKAGLLANLEEFERDQAAAMRRVDEGGLDNSGLLALARGYARAIDPEQRDQLAASIATRLSVDEAGVILRAAAAVRTAVPGIVLRAKANGDSTAEIARELDMTDSYVRRIARENRLVSWRLDLRDSELPGGAGWKPYEFGDDILATPYTEAHLADQVITAAGRGPRENRSRVLIWDGTAEQPDDAAIYTEEREPLPLVERVSEDLKAEFVRIGQEQKAERRRVAEEIGTHADPEDYEDDEDDDTSGHDWHHPTPLAGLVCRRCDLAHKNWAGENCPAA